MNRCAFLGLLVLCCSAACSAKGRQRRVVNGIVITDRLNPPYSAIKYFVWIGYDRYEQFFRIWRPQMLLCGGALLTPRIVQSACHCFSDIELPPRASFQRAVLDAAVHPVMVMGHSFEIPWVPPKPILWNPIIHPLCGEITGHWLVYDFALLVTKEEVELNIFIQPAPVNPLAEVAQMWRRVTLTQPVCLLVGYGLYIRRDAPTPSTVLRHAWITTMDYYDCYKFIGESLNITKYRDTYSKSCHKPLIEPLPEGSTDESLRPVRLYAKGDSGGPVSCDNVYFGVNSQYTSELHYIDDVAFYAYANSLEYRDHLVEHLTYVPTRNTTKKLDPVSHVDVTFPPNYMLHPNMSAPPHYFSAISSSATLRKNVHHFIVYLSASLVPVATR